MARLVPSGVTAALVALVLVARLACSLLLLLRECECCCCIATLSTALCSPCSICCCPQELQVRFKKVIFEYVILAGSTFSRCQVSHGLDGSGYMHRAAAAR